MKKPWPLVALGELLAEVSRPEPPEPAKTYRLLGMRWYAGGLFEKEQKEGRDIKANKIYRVEEGDIVYNRLFAWKGSFGVAEKDADGAFVSNEFPCFAANTDFVLQDYLKWCMARISFWAEVEALSTGASRQSRLRLKQERFLALKVPLPPIPLQRLLVAKMDQIAARIKIIRQLAEQVQKEETALLFQRVIEISNGVPQGRMAEVAPVLRRPVEVRTEDWYPELGIRSFGKGTFHKEAIKGSELGGKRIYRIEPGDLLFSNVFSWEGAIAVVQKQDKGRYGSHRFITCVPDPKKATPEFLCHYFLTEQGLADIRAASPGAAGRNKTLGIAKLESIKIPLPPIDVQHQFGELLKRVQRARNIRQQTGIYLDHLMPAVLDQAFQGDLLNGNKK